MDQLPLPILNEIFIQLHLQEKLQCMLVCRDWAMIIKTYTLYDTIKPTKWENFQQLLEIVKREPSRGKQVKRLVLGFLDDNMQELDRDVIVHLFPNLRLFEMPLYTNYQILDSQMQDKKEISIEHIMEYSGRCLISQILSTSLCPRLNYLSVASNGSSFEPARNLIDLLMNAPALSSLSMTRFLITFDDLELLHANLPLISSIALEHSEFQYNRSFSTVNLKPATLVSKFVLDTVSLSTTHFSKLVDYINKKYTKLTEFGASYIGSFNESRENAQRNVEEGLLSLFQGLGPQLKTLSLEVNVMKLNYFKIFEKANFNIQSFSIRPWFQDEIIHNVLHLDSLRDIQTLKLKFRKLNNLEWLRKLGFLKKLELECSHISALVNGVPEVKVPFQLNQLLDVCAKTLESLKIGWYPFNVDTSDTRHYSIKRLHIHNTPLPANLDSFLSASCPNLNSLTFDLCYLEQSRFSLPYHRLLSLEIKETHSFKMLLLETENGRHWYAATIDTLDSPKLENLVGKNDETIYRHSYPRPYDTWSGVPSMVFSCVSIQSLMIMHGSNINALIL